MKHPFNHSFSDLVEYTSFLSTHKKMLNGLISRNRGLGLIGVGLSLFRLVFNKAPTKSTVKILKRFSRDLNQLYLYNRFDYLIKYLKTAAVMLQHYVSRDETKHSSRDIGKLAVSATRSGLPRIIPSLQRKLIRQGDVKTITF